MTKKGKLEGTSIEKDGKGKEETEESGVKVAVIVSGGCVQDVYVSSEKAEVRIFDYDNMEEKSDEEKEEYEAEADKFCEGLYGH